MNLYALSMQVVPLLLIALFLDNRHDNAAGVGAVARWWGRVHSRLIALLGFLAFIISIFVVSDVTDPSAVTRVVVVAALVGAMGLLFSQIWRRFDHPAVSVRSVTPASVDCG